jgi:hypothetical protein
MAVDKVIGVGVKIWTPSPDGPFPFEAADLPGQFRASLGPQPGWATMK